MSCPIIRTRALSAAVKQSNAQIAELLLDNGTDPGFRQEDIPEPGYDEDGSEWAQLLLLAVAKQDLEMVKLLLNQGADANVWCSELFFERSDVLYRHVLFWAVELGNKLGRRFDTQEDTKHLRNPAMVNLLLEGSADPNLVDEYGQPPLPYVIRAGDEAHLRSLLDHANPLQIANMNRHKLTSVKKPV